MSTGASRPDDEDENARIARQILAALRTAGVEAHLYENIDNVPPIMTEYRLREPPFDAVMSRGARPPCAPVLPPPFQVSGSTRAPALSPSRASHRSARNGRRFP